MFLILSQNGMRLFSKQFLSESALNEQVVGDLLTAINNFVQETFETTGSIERVKHKEHTLIMRPMTPLMCCYVVKGQSYSALQKLDKFISSATVKEDLWNVLISSNNAERPLSSEALVDDLVSDVFSSPHQQVVLQDV